MTIIKTGTDYLDTKVEVILNNETEPIGNESIHIFCIGFEDNLSLYVLSLIAEEES